MSHDIEADEAQPANGKKKERRLSGPAGEHFVCGELLQRGWLAALLSSGSEGFDILARRPDSSRQLAIQVKTITEGSVVWPLGNRAKFGDDRTPVPDSYYVFVMLGALGERPRFFIRSADAVHDAVVSQYDTWKAETKRDGSPRTSKLTTTKVFSWPKAWTECEDAWGELEGVRGAGSEPA